MSEERLTASEVLRREQEGELQARSLRQRLLDQRDEESKHSLRRPTIAIVGFEEYVLLKMEVLKSCAEVMPDIICEQVGNLPTTGCSGSPYNLIFPLNQAGVECFIWNGILVVAAKTARLHGAFFL